MGRVVAAVDVVHFKPHAGADAQRANQLAAGLDDPGAAGTPHHRIGALVTAAPYLQALRRVNGLAHAVRAKFTCIAAVPSLAAGLRAGVRARQPVIRRHGAQVVARCRIAVEPVAHVRPVARGGVVPWPVVAVRGDVRHGRHIPVGKLWEAKAQAVIVPLQQLRDLRGLEQAHAPLGQRQAAAALLGQGHAGQRLGMQIRGHTGQGQKFGQVHSCLTSR